MNSNERLSDPSNPDIMTDEGLSAIVGGMSDGHDDGYAESEASEGQVVGSVHETGEAWTPAVWE